MSLTPEQLERTRYYRKLFELGADKAERDAIVQAAADDLGIKPRSVMCRWHDLGMCRQWNFMKPIVREAVARYPFHSDRTLALWFNVNFSSFSSTRRLLRLKSCMHRRRAALRAEVAIYVRDFPDLTPAEVQASIKADGEHPWPYSVRTIAQLINEVRDERAAS